MANKEEIYKGEMFIQTVTKEKGLEKHVFTRDSFVKNGILHLDALEADLAFKYDVEKIEKYQKSGDISTEDAEVLKEDIQSFEKQMQYFREWRKANPEATPEEQTAFAQSAKGQRLGSRKDTVLNRAIRKLIAKKDIMSEPSIDSLPELFKSVDKEECFGITKPLMDRIYHLPTLLKNAKIREISGNQWILASSVKTPSMGEIGLQHTFNAKSEKEAQEYKKDYIEWFPTRGLKVFSAYWKMACEERLFSFGAELTKIMGIASSEDRTSFFTVKEKGQFWADSIKLETTKLTVTLDMPKGKKKPEKLTFEHRMLDIGARSNQISEERYPNKIGVKILNTEDFKRQSQIGTAIKNNTLKLHPRDILLALSLQAREAQTMDKEVNTYDEAFMFARANLEKTANSNKSKARSDLKGKLERFEKEGVIAGFSKSKGKKQTYSIKEATNKKTKIKKKST